MDQCIYTKAGHIFPEWHPIVMLVSGFSLCLGAHAVFISRLPHVRRLERGNQKPPHLLSTHTHTHTLTRTHTHVRTLTHNHTHTHTCTHTHTLTHTNSDVFTQSM